MKIVRHIAPDMRKALRTIRAQLGEDAVILSSRRVPEGVEVTAAVDFEAGGLQNAASGHAASLMAAPLPPPSAPTPAPRALAPPQPARAASTTAAALTATVTPPAAAATVAARDLPPYPALAGTPATPVSEAVHVGAPAPAYSHAASSHYFPAPQTVDDRPFAHILNAENVPAAIPALSPAPVLASASPAPAAAVAPTGAVATTPAIAATRQAVAEPTTARREPTINIEPSVRDFAAEALAELPPPAPAGVASEAMGTELKTLRRMLETQLAQLA